jgi:hypothetical protein
VSVYKKYSLIKPLRKHPGLPKMHKLLRVVAFEITMPISKKMRYTKSTKQRLERVLKNFGIQARALFQELQMQLQQKGLCIYSLFTSTPLRYLCPHTL